MAHTLAITSGYPLPVFFHCHKVDLFFTSDVQAHAAATVLQRRAGGAPPVMQPGEREQSTALLHLMPLQMDVSGARDSCSAMCDLTS